VRLPSGKGVLFTDTVGFIQKLPTTLVAAFRATLEEVSEADLLLHVLDVTHPNARQQAQAVQDTLDELNSNDLPVIVALNKIDLLDQAERADVHQRLGELYEEGLPISAMTGHGVPDLLAQVGEELYSALTPMKVVIPYRFGQLISLFHEQAVVEHVEHRPDGVELEGRVPERVVDRFKAFVPKPKRSMVKRVS
jgi:GTP-binding protein HflX